MQSGHFGLHYIPFNQPFPHK